MKDREIAHTVEGLRKAGSSVEYHSVDVLSKQAGRLTILFPSSVID